MSLNTTNPLVITANHPNNTPSAAQSSLSIVHFPPDNPTIAFIRTSPQGSLKPPSTNPNPGEAWRENQIPRLSHEQAAIALQNLTAVLALADATPRDVTKLTVYFGPGTMGRMETLNAVLERFFTDEKGLVHRPPCTILRVDWVGTNGFDKVAVEAEAVVRMKPPSYDELS
ncbi:hypothetical protein BDW62DRAFT_139000 [Aspergillus aurantiobrunneus]